MEARWWLAQGMEEILFPSAGHFFVSGMDFFLAQSINGHCSNDPLPAAPVDETMGRASVSPDPVRPDALP